MRRIFTEEEADREVQEVVASFAMEGLHLTEEEKMVGKKILMGEIDGEKYIREYSAKVKARHSSREGKMDENN